MQAHILLCLALLFSLQAVGQIELQERLTIEQGLSQGMVYDITQTRDGYLWVGTKDGLNRYDGYNFKVFTHDPFDPYTLTENIITALFEDSRGLLWIGTESKGLNVYDPKTGLFHHFTIASTFKPGIREFDIQQIREAPDGSIYLIQRGRGLVHIQLPAEWAYQLPRRTRLDSLVDITLFPYEQFGESRADGYLTGIEMRPDGEIYVYGEDRSYHVDVNKGFVKPITPAWDGTAAGNYVYVPMSKAVGIFRDGQKLPIALPMEEPISNVVVRPLPDGGFWLAIDKQLWRLSPGEFPDFARPDWVVDANISAVKQDKNGNIWIGTMGYGLRKINPRKQLFHKGAAGESIWGLWRDPAGRYFCKIFNQVYPYQADEGALIKKPAFGATLPRILDMFIVDSTRYWLLGREHAEEGKTSLCAYHPATGKAQCHVFPTYVEHVAGKASAKVPFKLYPYARLLLDRAGHFWATGINGTLARFDTVTQQFKLFSYHHVFDKQQQSITAFALAEDGNGHIWIGTQRGLVRGIPTGEAMAFELFETQSDNPLGLSNSNILCLLPDPSAPTTLLWIGTKGGGINRLDTRTGVFEHIRTRQGLPNDVVYGILPGGERELWCSTNRGLAKLTLDSLRQVRHISAFTAAKGLQDNEFNTQAFFKADNGELLFGGVSGVNRFFPASVLPDSTPSPLVWVGLSINYTWEPLAALLNSQSVLHLEANQNNLSFEFALLDFTDPSTNRYRYRLVGLNADWVNLGTNRFCHFTDLAPGHYRLEVEGSNGEGVWQALSLPISIVIAPPWWRSAWAYGSYGMLFAFGMGMTYRFQVRRVKLREQVAYQHRETARIKALEQMKSNFFTNITHEFRTPLTLILEPARQIRQHPQDAKVQSHAHLIETNSKRLLEMVNKLLDLAKIEGGSMALEMCRGDICALATHVYQTFLPLAERRGISMSFSAKVQPIDCLFDAGKVEVILNNLLSNALKFTPEGGRVTLTVRKVPGDQRHPSYVEIAVADTGIGIPADAVAHVFDRFYQVDSPQHQVFEGTGIGLALTKELAVLMDGRIEVHSNDGQGTVFAVSLPLLQAQGSHSMNGVLAPIALETTSAPASTESGIVLLIEDNVELRGFLKQCLAEHWQVVEASNGVEGIQKAKDLIPDLVISDLMMPEQDGYAVCEALKNDELTAHIPIILLTARQAMDAKIKGLRVGADDYMAKPFNTEELLARMNNLVTLRRQLLQRRPANGDLEKGYDAAISNHLSEPDQAFLRRFTALIDEHISDEQLTVELLAQEMRISRVQLHRKLKAITEKNTTDFLRDYRLDRAMAMLANQEGLVYEVASRVGFGSEKYFSRAFKERFGIPPSKVVM